MSRRNIEKMKPLPEDDYEEQYENGIFDAGYKQGWKECKREVLKILEQDWAGLDMSINSCDTYYIDRIKKEL